MFGEGLIKGLGITLKHFFGFGHRVTQEYPEVCPELPPRSKGSFRLIVPKCISCGMCKNVCPNNVISLDSAKDEATNKKKLTSYNMMVERCIYCGFCVETCPTKALVWTPKFENAVYRRDDVNKDLFTGYRPSPEELAEEQAKEQAKINQEKNE